MSRLAQQPLNGLDQIARNTVYGRYTFFRQADKQTSVEGVSEERHHLKCRLTLTQALASNRALGFLRHMLMELLSVPEENAR